MIFVSLLLLQDIRERNFEISLYMYNTIYKTYYHQLYTAVILGTHVHMYSTVQVQLLK
jgi:hypothetical protein